MKPATLLAPEAVAMPTAAGVPLPAEATHTFFSDFCELVKARLTTLVLATTLAGFYLGWRGPMNYAALANALFGTALVAGGAAALNELIERDADANMRRTRDRPLPAGRLQPDAALLIGFVLAAGGLLYLYFLVNALSSLLAGVTLASYLFAYTPLKRITTLNTLVGGIPGALPPVIGWAAARGSVDLQAWSLFAILFCWQMPHFLAIAWMYRDDYAGAGFVMLPNTDEDGASTGRQAVNYSGALLLVSLTPSLLGLASPIYFFGAFALGAGMIYYAWQLQASRTRPRARRLFFASIIYLPFLLALLALCKQST
jgi:protoheme IX farnesyltransferase